MLGLGLPVDLALAGKSGAGSSANARNMPGQAGGSVFDGLLAGAGGSPHEDGPFNDPVEADVGGGADEGSFGDTSGPTLDPTAVVADQLEDRMAPVQGAAAGSLEPAGSDAELAELEGLRGRPDPGGSRPSSLPATAGTPSGDAEAVQGDGALVESETTAPRAAEDHAVAMSDLTLIRTSAHRNPDEGPTGSLEVPGLKTATLSTGDRADPLPAGQVGPAMAMSGQDLAVFPARTSAMSGAATPDGPGRTNISGPGTSGQTGLDMASGMQAAPDLAMVGARPADKGADIDVAIDAPSEINPVVPGKPARLEDARSAVAEAARDQGIEARALPQVAAPTASDAARTFSATGFEDAQGALQRLGLDLAAVAEQSARTARTSPGRSARSEYQLLGSVGAALRQASVDETGKTTLTLRPQGLGLIEIEISKDQENRVHMSMRVQNPMVLDAIQSDRPLISGMLESGGRGLSGFDLSGFDQGRRDRAPDRGAPAGPGSRGGPVPEADPQGVADATPNDTGSAPERVDILI